MRRQIAHNKPESPNIHEVYGDIIGPLVVCSSDIEQSYLSLVVFSVYSPHAITKYIQVEL